MKKTLKKTLQKSLFTLKASRPGLWFPTIWLYFLPLAGGLDWTHPGFWVGLLYVSFPLNVLVYGWNDLVDRETDRINPRKGSWLFGAQGEDAELDQLTRTIIRVQALFWPPLIALGGAWMLLTLLCIVAFCWLYNHPVWGWRKRPPLELFCQAGYLLTLPISVLLNDAPLPSFAVMGYLSLFCLQSQLIGEVMDVTPDRVAGRHTTATALGVLTTKKLIIATVLAEITLLGLYFKDWIFAAGLALFLGWLIVDIVKIGERDYTLRDFKLFGVGSNLVALGSMIYVLWSGSFL